MLFSQTSLTHLCGIALNIEKTDQPTREKTIRNKKNNGKHNSRRKKSCVMTKRENDLFLFISCSVRSIYLP